MNSRFFDSISIKQEFAVCLMTQNRGNHVLKVLLYVLRCVRKQRSFARVNVETFVDAACLLALAYTCNTIIVHAYK